MLLEGHIYYNSLTGGLFKNKREEKRQEPLNPKSVANLVIKKKIFCGFVQK